MQTAPTFASVARKLRDPWLYKVLKRLAINIEIDIKNAKQISRRSHIRSDVKRLKAEARRFEVSLNRVSKRLIDLPPRASGCLLNVRQAIIDIVTLCDTALTIIPAKAGRRKTPGKIICAVIVIEAWRFTHGKVPDANNIRVQQLCNEYWSACGRELLGQGDPSIWRRTLADAIKMTDQIGFRCYVRDEIQRSTK